MSKTFLGGVIRNAVINGRVYKNITGKVITIENGKMLVDGKPVEDWKDSEEKVINITIEGNVKGSIYTGSGDVHCGNVEEDVSTGSGDVHCGNVGGRVSTMSGDVYRR